MAAAGETVVRPVNLT